MYIVHLPVQFQNCDTISISRCGTVFALWHVIVMWTVQTITTDVCESEQVYHLCKAQRSKQGD